MTLQEMQDQVSDCPTCQALFSEALQAVYSPAVSESDLCEAITQYIESSNTKKLARLQTLEGERYSSECDIHEFVKGVTGYVFDPSSDDDDYADSDLLDDDDAPTTDELINAEFNTGEKEPDGQYAGN